MDGELRSLLFLRTFSWKVHIFRRPGIFLHTAPLAEAFST